MGEHNLPRIGDSSKCRDRDHAYQVVVNGATDTITKDEGRLVVQEQRVVCVKCGDVVNPFDDFDDA